MADDEQNTFCGECSNWDGKHDDDCSKYFGKKRPPPVEKAPNFKVRIEKMIESHRETYWVCLTNVNTRPANAKIGDNTGYLTTFYSEDLDKAEFTGQEYADFLGVELEYANEIPEDIRHAKAKN